MAREARTATVLVCILCVYISVGHVCHVGVGQSVVSNACLPPFLLLGDVHVCECACVRVCACVWNCMCLYACVCLCVCMCVCAREKASLEEGTGYPCAGGSTFYCSLDPRLYLPKTVSFVLLLRSL